MNINTKARKVLCFGDSNTWGFIPGKGTRYSKEVRWTGILQESLGDGFEIVEEGLNSRTTNIDDQKHVGKNGASYLAPCLETHFPIDYIVLFLGTNDLKERFHRSPQDIADGIQNLLDLTKNTSHEENQTLPKVILVCPPIVDESVEGVIDKYKGAEAKSRLLPKLYEELAQKNNCLYINLQEHLKPSKVDGYHFDRDSHKTLANLVERKLREFMDES
ncbi:MAG: SGNH/GDSL hydrolase family protein [Candidatus Roizmanbacteria bacterium]|nr:SGNH/GDSL hydrolase family protein [Candidatus Roizmanbacteria bacterium]